MYVREDRIQVPVAALDTEPFKIGVRSVIARRPRNLEVLQDERP
jgi:hypothetical protein